MRPDIVIIGGGIIGSSAAYFLARSGRAGAIEVIEPDPTYEQAATPRASGGCRRLFTRPENIAMSEFGIAFFKDFAAQIAVAGEAPEIGWKERGYLFLVPEGGVATLERNYRTQTAQGVEVVWLDRPALRQRYPSLQVEDVAAATLSPRDGWLDPHAALLGLRRKAQSLGVRYRRDRVMLLEALRGAVRGLTLASGERLTPDIVINAAGTWGPALSAQLGMKLPVEPMRRFDHYFECPTAIEPLPFLKEPFRLAFRPEGRGYAGSIVDYGEPGGHNFTVDHGYFERVVWPALAERVPAFAALRHGSSWVGHYDQNRFDGNMILGSWPEHLANFYIATGFSGHGLMHAPAVGRALSELVLEGRFATLDLAAMGYRRILEGRPYGEAGIW